MASEFSAPTSQIVTDIDPVAGNATIADDASAITLPVLPVTTIGPGAGGTTIVDDAHHTASPVSPLTTFSVLTPSPIPTSSPVSTSPRISTSAPVSTLSSLPASTSLASSTFVFSTTQPTLPPPPPGGLSTSAKIGIGLGVPLGVIFVAIVAFLGYLYGKRRGNKRNAIHAANEQFHGFPGDKDPSAMQGQHGAGAVGPQQSDDNGELPRYAEELQGSPAVKRHELPAQREATGYFSPDVVTK